jgi:hypothetical protein
VAVGVNARSLAPDHGLGCFLPTLPINNRAITKATQNNNDASPMETLQP